VCACMYVRVLVCARVYLSLTLSVCVCVCVRVCVCLCVQCTVAHFQSYCLMHHEAWLQAAYKTAQVPQEWADRAHNESTQDAHGTQVRHRGTRERCKEEEKI
jgi:hypothetical protein